jgi:transcriptional regulator with XRE-family HTH domain
MSEGGRGNRVRGAAGAAGGAVARLPRGPVSSARSRSRASGVQQAEVSRLEQGLGNPTLKTLSALGQVLGFELAAVLPGTVHPVALSEQEPEAQSKPIEVPVAGASDGISPRRVAAQHARPRGSDRRPR